MDFSDKRTNFRFPAYGDEAGVKLNRNKQTKEFVSDLNGDFPYSSNRKTQTKNANEVTLDPVEVLGQNSAPRERMPDMPVERASSRRQVVHHSSALSKRFDKSVPAIYKKNRGRGREERVYSSETSKSIESKSKVSEKNVEESTKNINQHQYVEPKEQAYQAPQSAFANKLYELDKYGQDKHTQDKSKKPKRSNAFKSSYNLPGDREEKRFIPALKASENMPKIEPTVKKEEVKSNDSMTQVDHDIMDSLRMLSQENHMSLDVKD